jgi:hypothetical protein
MEKLNKGKFNQIKEKDYKPLTVFTKKSEIISNTSNTVEIMKNSSKIKN